MSEVILWGVKPQFFDDAVPAEWNYDAKMHHMFSESLHISILAGTPISSIEQLLKSRSHKILQGNYKIKVIRCMPNLGCEVGFGALGYTLGPDVTPGDEEIARKIFSPTCEVAAVPEGQLNAICGLAGSGFGLMMPIAQALADAGVKMGLPRALSRRFAAITMQGAGAYLLQTGKHPGEVQDNVCSPGGTTIAGIMALEEAGVRYGVMKAVEEATKRADELAQRK